MSPLEGTLHTAALLQKMWNIKAEGGLTVQTELFDTLQHLRETVKYWLSIYADILSKRSHDNRSNANTTHDEYDILGSIWSEKFAGFVTINDVSPLNHRQNASKLLAISAWAALLFAEVLF